MADTDIAQQIPQQVVHTQRVTLSRGTTNTNTNGDLDPLLPGPPMSRSTSPSSSPSPSSASAHSFSHRQPPPPLTRPLYTHSHSQPHSHSQAQSRTIAVVDKAPAPTSITVTVSDAAVFCAGDKLSLTVNIANKSTNRNHTQATRFHRPPPRSTSAASFLPSSVSIDSLQLAAQSKPTPPSARTGAPNPSSSRWSWALPSPPAALSTWLSPSSNSTTPPASTNSQVDDAPDRPLTLMLGTIQLVGSITLDPLSIVPDTLAHLKSIAASTGLTFAQHEYPVFVSAKSILFVNLTLPLGHFTSYSYSTLLPLALPSTVRGGRFIKVAYRAVIECTLSPRLPPIRVICPFRVFSAFEADGASLTYDISEPIVQPREVAFTAQAPDPNDPASKPMSRARSRDDILELLTKLDESLDFATADDAQIDLLKLKGTSNQPEKAVSPELEYISKVQNGATFRRIDDLLQRAPAVIFDFSSEQGKIAKLKLRRSLYRIGDVITGVIDFREHTIPSLRISVFFESAESVSKEFSQQGLQRQLVKVVSQVHCNVMNMVLFPFSVEVPRNATPTYSTTAASLSFKLRVDIIVQQDAQADRSMFQLVHADEHSASLGAVELVKGQALSCSLPIIILPAPIPLHGDTASQEIHDPLS